MNLSRTEIPDVILIKPNVFSDDRGYFFESFRENILTDYLGYKVNFCQNNESKSSYGVLRGLHYQAPPFSQTKLVRVIQGRVLDVAVDIRSDSPTFGMHVAVELNDVNKKQLLIPKGFAHGFVTLSKTAILSYKVDNYFNREFEKGIAFDDLSLNINWKIQNLKISKKDMNQPLFKDLSQLF